MRIGEPAVIKKAAKTADKPKRHGAVDKLEMPFSEVLGFAMRRVEKNGQMSD